MRGFARRFALTLFVGFGASIVSLILAIALCATSRGDARLRDPARGAATASGDAACRHRHRLRLSGGAERADRARLLTLGHRLGAPAPGIATVNDAYGLSLIAGSS